MKRGIVKRFSPLHGYGFLGDPSVDGDVFVHWRDIQTSDTFKALRPGQEVTYELERGPKGALARKVTPVVAARQSA